ncbi:phosphatidylinositol mannoside acyltransferase [Micromonospora yasonensis]|uniref:phosphatidylinositol mannoside acyltransferase n=1 Tax=Micromonospora yasonensis TaxID=1128667 RepID=UPI00222FAC7F|nr:phosphatidylinositol mannoside acyltransferase [Micromonospora yasonensis]MCW3843854.1 phosphatidylinositol mannoside acyltransferase [Micromonospora yasonensis]
MNLTEAGYVTGWRLARALPRPVVAAAFRAGADRAHRRGGRGAARLRANLRRVVGPELSEPELDDLVKRGLRSYARYWMEAFRLPALSRREILAGFRLDGVEKLAADVAEGRGAVVALPHAGNWDAAGAWVAATGWPITTVAERLRPEGVYERFLAFRQGLGMEILPTHGGDRPAFDVLLDRLRAGAVVPLLADRDLSARGVEVEFFGGRTRMPAGPALLAIRSGAPLYVTSMWYEPDVARGAIEGPLPLPDPESGPLDKRVRAVTQRIADGLAAGIARHPEDWHMLQRMWLDQAGTNGGADTPAPRANTGTI